MEDQEKKVLNIARDLWDEFLKLSEYHSSDKHEVAQAIHVIQNIVMARKAVRDDIDDFFKMEHEK